MADVLITNLVASYNLFPGIVMVDTLTFYFFFVDTTDTRIRYVKSTDGGATWGSPVNLDLGTTVGNSNGAIWYDRWTAGDTGTEIHLAYSDSVSEVFYYNSLDTSGDSVNGRVAMTASVIGSIKSVGIAKAIDGKLYAKVGFAIAPTLFLRSTTGGASWGGRTDVTTPDARCRMFSAQWRDDDADIAMVAGDVTDTVKLLEYDNSANSWPSTTTILTATVGSGHANIGAAPRASDGHLIVCMLDIVTQWTDIKLRVFDVNGAASITELTNIVIDIEAGFTPSVFVDVNDDIYIAYAIVAAGSRSDAAYVISTNGGTTWSSPVSFPEAPPTNIKYLSVPHNMPDGGLFAPLFIDNSPTPDEAFLNLNNSVAVGGAATLNRGGAIIGSGGLSRRRIG